MPFGSQTGQTAADRMTTQCLDAGINFFDTANMYNHGRAGKTLIELSLQWLLSQQQVDSVILGASNPEQLAENLKAAEGGPFPAEVLEECDKVWKRLRGITPKYNR